ncbi:MAG: type ISP restriction/modification enzyme [Methylocystis sp.]
MFLARLNSDDKQVTLRNAEEFIPGSFRLIRELVDFLSELEKDDYRDVRWVVEEVLSIVNGLDLPAIHEDLSFRARRAINRKVRAADEEEHRLFERDPFIYFYEDYLKAYDAKMRKSRGVYYTPPPIVNFIVRAVDDILKESFGIREGLADSKRVTVLDFACGTGTFLLEVFQRIFDNIGGADKGRADPIVREHLLKNIYGFEYLIAPYTIAHLKLSQFLKDKDHPLTDDQRLQVYLTNTLEPIEPQTHLLVPAITAEVKAAQAVKDKKILVITGNPPYAGHSKNPSERVIQESVHERRTNKGIVKLKRPKSIKKTIKTAIGVLIEDYKFVDGEPLGETNPKWLQDDYVKFIRFAQNKMDAVEEGIVAIITNHSYLDNATFRGMRPSLMKTFDSIYIVDLHGSTKPKEPTPAATKNENVFDIQKGVAIALFVKKRGLDKGVWFNEFWGSRQEKYETAARTAFREQAWQRVQCVSPYYMFRPLNWTGWEEYHAAWPIADSLSAAEKKQQIFELNVLGFQTHRDHFAIAFDEKEIFERAKSLIDDHFSDSELAERYSLKSNSDWKVGDARAVLRKTPDWERQVIQCAYRPFDNPFCFFGEAFMDRPRRELIEHVAARENLQLLVSRQIGTKDWRHTFITDAPPNDCVVSDMSREANYCFPIWLFRDGNKPSENISSAFRDFIDAHYDGHHYEAEEILGYIYAILHAPTYRRRYAEFLRIDFPRVPFAEKREDFEKLSKLGTELIEAHLLRKFPRCGLADYHGRGDDSVEKPRYVEAEARVLINETQSFAPVPKNVWEFHIGGYQVLDKYLKSRKGRRLSLDEINHVAAVADTLAFTIDQMARIDDAWAAAFPDRG